MGRSRRKVGARRYADYSQETLNTAVELVKSKALSSYEAEKHFNIPRRTILNKCKNRHDKAIGRPIGLTAEEEKHIAEVVEIVADFGSPLSILDLRIVVYNYLEKCGKTALFKGKMPGERWARNFLERHNFTQRATQNIKRSRAAKTVEEMTIYYENLESSLKDVPCENILNFDETNLNDDPGSKKAIFKRGTKHPERVINSSKSSVSIMFSGTADGQCLPPYVVYKAEHLWSRWCEGGPPNARYNRTKSGWFDMCCFDDWFKTIILPWARSREGVKVVIGDNLASHLSVEVVRLCQENNIRLVFLPPNATHLTQPLDVAFFGPKKKSWREILLKYKLTHQNSTTINKCDFPQLLQQLMTNINMDKKSNICSGFAGSGIFPFNPARVISKIPVVAADECVKFDACLLEYLQKIRTPTTQSKTGSNKKLAIAPGKSISTEDAENMKKGKTTKKDISTDKAEKPIKGKGKGKTTKKCPLDAPSLPLLKQPKSLQSLSMETLNKCLLSEKTVNYGAIKVVKERTTLKRKLLTSDVRCLSEMSKTENENLPFVAVHTNDLPKCLQPTKTSKVTILSEKIIKAGSSTSCDKPNNICKKIKNQHANSENNCIKKEPGVTLEKNKPVLQIISIPKNKENVQFNRNKKQNESKKFKSQKKLKPHKPTRHRSSSTTSVSDDMSIHTDSSIIAVDLEGETTDSGEIPLSCFKKSSSFNFNAFDSDDSLNDIDEPFPHDDIAGKNIFATSSFHADADDVLSQSKTSRQVSWSPNLKMYKEPIISDAEMSDEIPNTNNEPVFSYSENDKVLVRYYSRYKKWKYYIGVITACNSDQTFDISFLAMTRNNGELKFKFPKKKIDRDTVPKVLIEKIIKIDKISDKPEEYKLHDQGDADYF